MNRYQQGVRIEVTDGDIARGRPGTVCHSPVGLAMERTFGIDPDVGGHIDAWPDGTANGRTRWTLPRSATRAIRRFYRGGPLQPFAFYVDHPTPSPEIPGNPSMSDPKRKTADTPGGYQKQAQNIPKSFWDQACKRGHPFDKGNTRIRPNGTRLCRRCHREREAARIEARLRLLRRPNKRMKLADMRAMRDGPNMTDDQRAFLDRAIERLAQSAKATD